MLTFVGKGYSPAFVENYRQIARRLSAGEAILVVAGPDDICAPLLEQGGEADAHCHGTSVVERDRLAAAAVSAIAGRTVVPGARIVPDEALLERLRAAFRDGDVRTACGGCEWFGLCSHVAGQGYPGILVGVAPAAGPRS